MKSRARLSLFLIRCLLTSVPLLVAISALPAAPTTSQQQQEVTSSLMPLSLTAAAASGNRATEAEVLNELRSSFEDSFKFLNESISERAAATFEDLIGSQNRKSTGSSNRTLTTTLTLAEQDNGLERDNYPIGRRSRYLFEETIYSKRALEQRAQRDNMSTSYEGKLRTNQEINLVILYNDSTILMTRCANKYYYWEEAQTIIDIVIFVMIVIGNLSILHRLKSCKRRRSNVNYFIVQLAVADLFVGLFNVSVDLIWRLQKSYNYSEVTCVTVKYFSIVLIYASTYLLVALSFDRWEAVVKPLAFTRNRNRGRYLVAGAWLLAFIAALPASFFMEASEVEGIRQCWINFGPLGWRIYMVYLLLSVLVIPVIIITICYVYIVYTIWSKGRRVVKRQQQINALTVDDYINRRKVAAASAAAAVTTTDATSTTTAGATSEPASRSADSSALRNNEPDKQEAIGGKNSAQTNGSNNAITAKQEDNEQQQRIFRPKGLSSSLRNFRSVALHKRQQSLPRRSTNSAAGSGEAIAQGQPQCKFKLHHQRTNLSEDNEHFEEEEEEDEFFDDEEEEEEDLSQCTEDDYVTTDEEHVETEKQVMGVDDGLSRGDELKVAAVAAAAIVGAFMISEQDANLTEDGPKRLAGNTSQSGSNNNNQGQAATKRQRQKAGSHHQQLRRHISTGPQINIDKLKQANTARVATTTTASQVNGSSKEDSPLTNDSNGLSMGDNHRLRELNVGQFNSEQQRQTLPYLRNNRLPGKRFEGPHKLQLIGGGGSLREVEGEIGANGRGKRGEQLTSMSSSLSSTQRQRQKSATRRQKSSTRSTGSSKRQVSGSAGSNGILVVSNSNSGAQQHGSGVIPKARIKTIKMTLVIVVAFILCWAPFCIINVCSVFGILKNDTYIHSAITTLSQSLAHLNSAVNPIIFWLFSSKRNNSNRNNNGKNNNNNGNNRNNKHPNSGAQVTNASSATGGSALSTATSRMPSEAHHFNNKQ